MPTIPVLSSNSTPSGPQNIRARAPQSPDIATPVGAPTGRAPDLRTNLPSLMTRAPQVARADVTNRSVTRALATGLSTDQASASGRQLSDFGRSVGNVADTAERIYLDVQNQANRLMVDDALNKAKERATRLQFGTTDGSGQKTEPGFLDVVGFDALNRESGKPLADEYAERFDEEIAKISEGLKSDNQRRDFNAQAQQLRGALQGAAIRHESEQFRAYNLSVNKGTIATELKSIEANYTNPEFVETGIARLRAATADTGFILGRSAAEIASDQLDATSQAHSSVLEASLQDDNIEYADAYLRQYAAEMNPAAVLKYRGQLGKEVDGRVSTSVAEVTTTSMMSAASSDDLGRAVNVTALLDGPKFGQIVGITRHMESRGRANAEGPNVPGQGTAKGEMQVMDATNADPGYGVKPARDNSPEERARVGRDYLAAMIREYKGDMAMAWAAYNAGPGRLNDAISASRDSGRSWLSHMPRETRDYVAQGLRMLGEGGGTTPKPTLAEVVDAALAHPDVRNSPERRRLTEQEVTRRYRMITEGEKQREDEGYDAALRAVEANGGSYAALPASVKAAIPPDKVSSVMSFANTVGKGEDVQTDDVAYLTLSNDEYLASLTDAQLYAFRAKLSEGDFQSFARHRGSLIAARERPGSASNGPGELNTPAINVVLNNRLESLGIDPNPSRARDKSGAEAMRVGAVQRFVRQSILVAQAQHGKKFTDLEVEQHIDGLFSKSLTFKNSLWGGQYDQQMLTMRVRDIPPESIKAIRDEFRKRGIPNPSDGDVLSAYWRAKSR